ncbi:MAG: gluconokinase [Leucobacter sp.]
MTRSRSSAADAVIGVDMGTTATKVVAFTPDGALLASASHGYPLEEPEPGHAVQDPEQIFTAVCRAVTEVVNAVGAHRVAGLSFSSALHSIMPVDAKGRPLTQLATWADTRATELAEPLRSSARGLALHQRTGTPIHPMSPLTKLMWFREHDTETHAAATHWVGIKAWVLRRLTGQLVVDHSLASSSGLLDIHRLEWDEEALSLAGIRADQLPELVPTRSVLSGLTEESSRVTGLPLGTRIVVGAGDGPLANLGVGAVQPGVATCSLGTSGSLRVTVDRPAVDANGKVFCYAITEDLWVTGGGINNGGVALQWVRDEIAADRDLPMDELLDIAQAVPAGSGGLLMLPHLLSERAPHWSSLARGAYVGLTRAHSREHLVRAAVEGVSMQLALVLQSMREAGLAVSEMRATGGTMRHPLWPHTIASALNMPIALPDVQEGSCFGAALLGMEALGLIASIDVAADLVRIDRTVEPDREAADVYASLLPVFDDLYDALLPANRRLRELAATLPLSR